MDIENLIKNIKTKLLKNSYIQNVEIEDKTYLHLKHKSHEKNKYHVKLTIFSADLLTSKSAKRLKVKLV